MYVAADFPSSIKLIWVVQILPQKYFRFHGTQITGLISAIPFRERGRWPSSLTLGRDAVDAVGTIDELCWRVRRSRVVLTSRRWRQVGGVIRLMTVTTKPGDRLLNAQIFVAEVDQD